MLKTGIYKPNITIRSVSLDSFLNTMSKLLWFLRASKRIFKLTQLLMEWVWKDRNIKICSHRFKIAFTYIKTSFITRMHAIYLWALLREVRCNDTTPWHSILQGAVALACGLHLSVFTRHSSRLPYVRHALSRRWRALSDHATEVTLYFYRIIIFR